MAELTEAQQAWVNELRTTDKPQIDGVLKKVDKAGNTIGYCCLGVWCEMAMERGTNLDVTFGFDVLGYLNVSFDQNWSDLPPRAQEALDVFNSDPRIAIKNLKYDYGLPNHTVYGIVDGEEFKQDTNPIYLIKDTLASLNDAGFTFSQLADLIEYAGLTD